MPHRTRPMAALLMFTGLNMVLIHTEPHIRVRNMIKWICHIPHNDDTDLTDFPDDLPIEENNSRTGLTNLPDEIVIKILSKLPLRYIMNLQTVCKKWLALTSSPYFAETHFKSPTKSQISNDNELDLFFFDNEADRYKLVKIMGNGFVRVVSNVSPMLVGSYDGLLVFQMFLGSRFLVWDLVTREYTYIDAPANVVPVPSPSHLLSLTAILSHSITQGFKLLFSSQITDLETGLRYEFFVYESGNNMWKKLTTSTYAPTSCINQVVVNPTIYKNCVFWMAPCDVKGLVNNPPCRSSVVIFSMNAEEFHSMPHPGNVCDWNPLHKHMYFFEVKGQLYFCHNSLRTIDIWSLEGYDRWIWVKIHDIKLDYPLKAISSESFPSERYGFHNVRLMKIEGDRIFFHCSYRGLFMYDFRKTIVKKVDQERKGDYVFLNSTNQFTYSDSSVSLKSGFRCRQRHEKIHVSVII